MKKQKKKNFFFSALYAWRGIVWNVDQESHMRFHFFACVVIGLLAYVLKVSVAEWLTLFVLFALVPTLEILNSAIEELCNTVRDELKLSYQATKVPRDLAAGAVLWTSIISIIISLIIFAPKIIALLVTWNIL
ncbi:MAG: diacylglycerol kinase family protein [bacterium]|nr:diacylglycerol kinase family protein [bacterium]